MDRYSRHSPRTRNRDPGEGRFGRSTCSGCTRLSEGGALSPARVPLNQKRYLEEIVKLHSSSYQRLLLTTVDSSIPIDLSQERDTDPVFRQMAADEIALIFEELRLPFYPLPSEGRDVVVNDLAKEIHIWTRDKTV